MAEEEKKLSLAESIRRRMKEEKDAITPPDPTLLQGCYRILEQVSEDRTTISFKVGHVFLNCFYKVILLKPEFRDDQEVIQTFQHDARMAAREEKSVEGRLIDLAKTADGLPFIVYEWEADWNFPHARPVSAEQEKLLLGSDKKLLGSDKKDASVMPLKNQAVAALSPQELQVLDRLKEDIINRARVIVDRMKSDATDATEARARAISELEQNGLRAAWHDAISTLMYRIQSRKHSVQMYIGRLLEDFVANFGEEAVRQFLIEDLSQPRRGYSNKHLALAFKIALEIERPDVYMMADEKTCRIKEFERAINEIE